MSSQAQLSGSFKFTFKKIKLSLCFIYLCFAMFGAYTYSWWLVDKCSCFLFSENSYQSVANCLEECATTSHHDEEVNASTFQGRLIV